LLFGHQETGFRERCYSSPLDWKSVTQSYFSPLTHRDILTQSILETILTQGRVRNAWPEVPKCPSIYQPLPNAHNLPARAEIPSRRPSDYGNNVEKILLPKPVPAEKKGFYLDETSTQFIMMSGQRKRLRRPKTTKNG